MGRIEITRPQGNNVDTYAMLYLFYGTDAGLARKKAQALVNSLRAKKPDAAYEEITADNWNAAVLESHLGGQGLFSNRYIVFLNRVADNGEAAEQIAGFIPAMNESPNIFIALEGRLNAELKNAFAKSAEKMVECRGPTSLSAAESRQTSEGFNIFALADAMGGRDPFKAWSAYRQAIDSGIEPENILGTLFWQAKSMILAAEATNAKEAGLNPFVFGKSKRYAGNFSEKERRRLLKEIIILYHDAHRGLVNSELGTEKLLLNLKAVER